MSVALRLREVLNWLNLSTPFGLLVAGAGGATVRRDDRGRWICTDYAWGFPVAGAFTIGNVVTTRHDEAWLAARPILLQHEDRHCTQYVFCVGLILLPLYVAAMFYSWLIAGDHSSYNPFERLANLADGGYPEPRTRRAKRSER